MNENSNKTFYAKAAKGSYELKFTDIFRDVFKKHTDKDLESALSAGLAGNIPDERNMLENWQRPWLFFRFLALGIIAFFLTMFIRGITGCDAIILGAPFIIGAVVVPVTLVLFFYELNIPRNIPIYKLLGYMVIGGIFESIVCSIITDIFAFTGASSEGIVGAIVTGITEEITKLIILCVIVSRANCKGGLNGLLIGAAVGAGFSFFETNGYALLQLIMNVTNTGDIELALDAAESNLILRGACAIDGHVALTAIYGCALGLVKGKGKLSSTHFANPIFLISFFASIVFHAFWDLFCSEEFCMAIADSKIGELVLTLFAKYHMDILVFAIAEYSVLWWLMKLSFKQVVVSHAGVPSGMVHQPAGGQPSVVSAASPVNVQSSGWKIECIAGEYLGSTYSPGYVKPITIGRAPDCGIKFAADTKGISGHHCEIGVDSEGVYIKDLNSSYGTFIASGERIQSNLKIHLKSGDVFWLASEKCKFRVVK